MISSRESLGTIVSFEASQAGVDRVIPAVESVAAEAFIAVESEAAAEGFVVSRLPQAESERQRTENPMQTQAIPLRIPSSRIPSSRIPSSRATSATS